MKTQIIGEVVHGKKRGRTIGYPTANIKIDKDLRDELSEGTFAGSVRIGVDEYPGAIFIPAQKNFLEVFIVGFDGDLYGQEIIVTLWKFLRENQKFATLDLLKRQIEKDIDTTVELIKP